jgi:5-methylcytosine-specific restriction enzyme A
VKAPALCSEPGCGNLTDKGRCEEHEREHRRAAGTGRGSQSSSDPHGPKWRIIRAAYLRRHPRCECEECARLPEARRPPATEVHHIDERGGNSDANLLAMTKAHHSRITARLQPAGFNAFRQRPKIRR